MKYLILLFFFITLNSLNSFSANVPHGTMLCTRNDPDFKEIWRGFPKCNRNVPYWVKSYVYMLHGISDEDRHLYTIDHCIALSLSGSNHVDNLGPQLRSKSTARLEFQLYLKVKRGEMEVERAIDILLEVKDNCIYTP